jgi:putative salt-induced outer membrane protein YdiY
VKRLAILCLAGLLVGAVGIFAPRVAGAQPEAPALARERSLADAMHARDREGLERLLAPDFALRSNPDIDRDRWIGNALTLCWGARSDIANFQAFTREDVEVASFELTFYVDPQTCRPAVMRSLITDVWTRDGDTWRLRTRHSGPVPAEGAGIAAQYGAVPELPPVWDVTGELSLVDTGGNTSTTTVGLSADALHRAARGTTRATVRFLSSEADAVTLARAVSVEGRHGLRLGPALEVFARAAYARDRFAGIDNRAAADIGTSWSLRFTPGQTLTTEAAAGFTHEERLDGTSRFATATGTIGYAWRITPGTQLRNDATVVADLDVAQNWRGSNAAAVTVTLTRVLSLKASHVVEYRNEPVPGFVRLDRRSGAALVLSIQRRR